ncbi:MAG: YdeI/OmpD-associated family protein [Myxococcota bacterium]
MLFYTHRFEAEVAKHDLGRYAYTVVYLPTELVGELPFEGSPRLRVDAEVSRAETGQDDDAFDGGEFPFQGAWQPSKGRWYLMLSKALLRTLKVGEGDRVEVRFRLADPEEVEVPPELEAAISADPKASSVWAELSAGKRRAWAHRVSSAKRAETRARRIDEVVEKVRAGGQLR